MFSSFSSGHVTSLLQSPVVLGFRLQVLHVSYVLAAMETCPLPSAETPVQRTLLQASTSSSDVLLLHLKHRPQLIQVKLSVGSSPSTLGSPHAPCSGCWPCMCSQCFSGAQVCPHLPTHLDWKPVHVPDNPHEKFCHAKMTFSRKSCCYRAQHFTKQRAAIKSNLF